MAAVTLFIHDLGPIESMLIMAATNFAATFRISGMRIEAEVEADHYQTFALMLVHRIRAYDPIFAGQRGQAFPAERPDIRDTFMNAPDNRARNETLARMQYDAARGRLQTCEYYLWYRAWRADVLSAASRILLFAVCAAIVGMRAIEITPLLLQIYGVVCAVLVACSVWKWRRNLWRLNAAIAERQALPVAAMAA